jgi:sodium/potassium-transporting ATPase subunit alpha
MSANNKSLVGRPAPSTRLQQSFIEGSQRVTHSRMMRKTGKGKGADLDALKQEIEMDEHIIDVEELCERLNTHQTDGLTTSKAAEKLARDGPNKLTPPTGTPTWKKLAKHLFGGFSALLWIAAILAFITYAVSPSVAEDNLYIGIVVVIVIVGTGIFSYMQEAKSLALMKNFANMIPDSATVVRGGMKKTVNSEDLVVGDLVEVSMGNKTPADIRLISTAGLKVDNSSLTGESEPQSRVAQMTDENPMESKNIMFYSTPVLEGSGMGIVLRTGDETLIGRIAALATGTKNVKTPIAREIEHLVKVIATIACTTGLIFLIVGLSKFGVGSLDQVVKSILFAIGIIIASVPEGLLATMTVALTLTAKRMAAKNVLVKNLESVETLGSTTTICSDKTGTLTQNRMTVAHIWMDKKIYSANSPVEEHGFSRDAPSFKMFNQVAAICNTANFDPEDMDTPVKERACIGGNATDYAILKFSHVVHASSSEPSFALTP